MSEDALARRNLALAAQQHASPRRYVIRNLLLQGLARLPVRRQDHDGHTILLFRPDHLGDVLLTTPAICALKRSRPDARLVALVGPWSADVLRAYDEIDEIITLDFPGFTRKTTQASLGPYRLAWEWARKLRTYHAQAAIIFRPDHWWGALLAKWAGVPMRIGYALPDVAPFLNHGRREVQDCHVVEKSLLLVEYLVMDYLSPSIKLRYPVKDSDREKISALLAAKDHPAKGPSPMASYLCIHPGSGTQVKQWAAEKWAAVADTLAERWDTTVIFTGGAGEKALIEGIMAQTAAKNICLAGETTVGTLAALYEGARIVLGPDSGPLHLAVAVETPTVALFGPADPVEFGPWGDPARHAILTTDIACRPCRVLDWPHDDPANHPCVRDIKVEDVVTAAFRVIDAS